MPEREFIRQFDPERKPTSDDESLMPRRPSDGQSIYCSHFVETCVVRTKKSYEGAVRNVIWKNGKPFLTATNVLEIYKSVNKDNDEEVLARLGTGPPPR